MRRAAWPLLIGLAACGGDASAPPPEASPSPATPVHSAPVPDGEWLVVSIDGEPVDAGAFFLTTREGRIMGGYDGCNSWSKVAGEPDLIESTLQGCGKSARMMAYDTVALSAGTRYALAGDMLIAELAGYRLSARRLRGDENIARLIADQPNLIPHQNPPVRPDPPPAP